MHSSKRSIFSGALCQLVPRLSKAQPKSYRVEEMKHFLLIYHLDADFMERRHTVREEHLQMAWEFVSRGELILTGALSGTPERGVSLLAGESIEVVARYVSADPYTRDGLVTKWDVREWITVAGEGAASPLKTS